ncbi:MAG: hypothetical protein H6624_04445 [Bdellovibrionaceae bacterium]|nr:hypothetical protein [Bdellovibrionales bacterium]MCB9083566.1 hypothetical protein [Pseudobdellovibrionaceae bacterium]
MQDQKEMKKGFAVHEAGSDAGFEDFKDLSEGEIEGALSCLGGPRAGQGHEQGQESKASEKTPDLPPKTPLFDANLNLKFSEGKSRTSQRLKYEAEVSVIQKQLGSLEEIRQNLGLSRRKMCQLLMVDPSAWTRWTKVKSKGKKAGAPPHIFRALQWYHALIDNQPGWHPQNSFNAGENIRVQDEKLGRMQEDLERQIAYLKKENNRLEELLGDKIAQLETRNPLLDYEKELSIGMGWKLLALVNFVALILILLAKMGWI